MAGSRLLAAYAAVGKDALKRERALARFRQRSQGPFADFDFDEIEASKEMDEEALARILASLDRFPMGPGPRLVVLRSAEELPKFAAEGLAAYLSDPNPEASLLVLAERLDKRSKLYKAIAAQGAQAIIDCAPPRAKDLSGQVVAMAAELGLSIDFDASRELIDRVGKDTVMLSRTLRTLRELNPGERRITRRLVETSVSRVAGPGPWAVADAVAARDARSALASLGAMEPGSEISVHLFVTRRIRELLIAKELDAEGRSRDLAGCLGLKPYEAWRCKNHLRDARRFSRTELVGALEGALACELALKGSKDSKTVLTLWIVSVCAGARARIA